MPGHSLWCWGIRPNYTRPASWTVSPSPKPFFFLCLIWVDLVVLLSHPHFETNGPGIILESQKRCSDKDSVILQKIARLQSLQTVVGPTVYPHTLQRLLMMKKPGSALLTSKWGWEGLNRGSAWQSTMSMSGPQHHRWSTYCKWFPAPHMVFWA